MKVISIQVQEMSEKKNSPEHVVEHDVEVEEKSAIKTICGNGPGVCAEPESQNDPDSYPDPDPDPDLKHDPTPEPKLEVKTVLKKKVQKPTKKQKLKKSPNKLRQKFRPARRYPLTVNKRRALRRRPPRRRYYLAENNKTTRCVLTFCSPGRSTQYLSIPVTRRTRPGQGV